MIPLAAPPLPTALAGLIAMAAAMGIGRFAYTPILPVMMADLGWGAGAAGLIASANYLGYLAGAVAAAYGWAAGLERRLVLAGLVVSALLLAAMGMAESVAAFVVIRFLAGVASAFVMVFGAAIVLSHGAASGRAFVQSVHFGGVGTGMALSSLVVGGFALAAMPWQADWFAMAALGLAAVVAVAWLLPPAPFDGNGGPARGKSEPPLVWTGRLKALTLAYGIFGFGYIITATFLVAIVRAEGGSAGFEALVWLATGLAAAFSVAIGQPFVRRFGLVPVFAGGCLVEGAGVAASVLLPSPAGPLLGGVLLGGTFVLITAYGLQIGRSLAPESPRRIFAFMTAAFGIGQIAGPLAAGYLSAWTGTYTAASLIAAGALLLSAGLAVMTPDDAPPGARS